MLETPQIIETTSQAIALIRLKIPKDQIQHVMGPGITDLMGELKAQEIAPTGPWFTHHLEMSSDYWNFEISLPVTKPVVAAGRVEPGILPAMKVARTVYQGPYEGLGEAWGEFLEWLGKNGYQVGEDLWECYLAGPESGPDPAGWHTEFTKQLL